MADLEEGRKILMADNLQGGKMWSPSKTAKRKIVKVIGVTLAVISLLAAGIFIGALAVPKKDDDTQSPANVSYVCDGTTINGGLGVCAKHGMVSTTHYKATQAALGMLREGGNAFDAAIAAQFALSVVAPESTGIGGGCFVLFYNASSKKVMFLDGREEAPASMTPNVFCLNATCAADPLCNCTEGAIPWDDRRAGGVGVGVPGVVAAMQTLLTMGATKPLATLMAPAITLASDGFPMTEHLYNSIVNEIATVSLFNATRQLFLKAPNYTSPKAAIGETFKNPDFAATLQLLASSGLDEFYNGTLATEFVAAVIGGLNPNTNRTGNMTVGDLQGYRAVFREPTQFNYRGNYTIYGGPPPCSGGGTMALILNMLENFPLSETQSPPYTAVEYLQKSMEAQSIAFADRDIWMGDMDFVEVPLSGFFNKSYANGRASMISPFKATSLPVAFGYPNASMPAPQPASKQIEYGTTHFTIMDEFGNIVSCTTTIEAWMGSGVVVPGRGFLLNNELTDFTDLGYINGKYPQNSPSGERKPRRTAVPPSDPTLLGGKRPLSSMTPTIVFRNDVPWMALGSPGGSTIIGSVLNAIIPMLDFGMGVQAAVNMPRVYARNAFPDRPSIVEQAAASSSVPATTAFDFPPLLNASCGEVGNAVINMSTALCRRGFSFDIQPYVGFVEAAKYENGSFWGAADITRIPEGSAEGF